MVTFQLNLLTKTFLVLFFGSHPKSGIDFPNFVKVAKAILLIHTRFQPIAH